MLVYLNHYLLELFIHRLQKAIDYLFTYHRINLQVVLEVLCDVAQFEHVRDVKCVSYHCIMGRYHLCNDCVSTVA